ncbi:MAG: NAD-dependent epimerase/dehydratase family protein [Treponema sp.]|jgi:nucleoside-diphosphate-sugar epimerase|nr:NAD-dependent epimerase/dehydratase family protein [Treponema sp.]
MKAVIIGGRGKVGSYLVPLLAKEGFSVINVSRGKTKPNVKDDVWEKVTQLNLDRKQPEFEAEIAKIKADVVFDMICFENDEIIRLINALRGSVSHYLVTGTIWVHGPSGVVPATEDECREPMETYGIQKDLMEKTIVNEYKKHGFPGTIIHPGHIVCPGDIPINPQGSKSLDAYKILKAGDPLYLPNFGLETIHHVHAADVAGIYMAALKTGKPSFGEGFHAVSPRAVTLQGFAKEVALWYGKKADIRFEPFEIWKKRVPSGESEETYSHITHSPNLSMQKAKDLLAFVPKYTSYEAIKECLASFGL